MDPDIVARAQAGDRFAFRLVVERSGRRLKSVAYRILRDPYLAEDVVQEALVAMWQSLPQLRDPGRFDAWSYRFVVRACAREATRARRSRARSIVPDVLVTPDSSVRVDERDVIERAFERLSVDHRSVLVLHYFLDLTLEDTAEVLGVSVGTAKSRLHRAITRMRLVLHADVPERLEPGTVPAP